MSAEFSVQLTAKDLFRFNMRSTYTTLQGPISIIIAILFAVSGVVSVMNGNYQYMALYFAMAILFVAYIPCTLWFRSKKTIEKNEVLSGVLNYRINEDGIEVISGEETGSLPWEYVFKMVSNKQYLLIYSNRIHAYIIPRAQMKEHYETVKAIASEKLEKYRVRMK